MKILRVYFDGACKNNNSTTGNRITGIGIHTELDGKVLDDFTYPFKSSTSDDIGVPLYTNNQAEWMGMTMAIYTSIAVCKVHEVDVIEILGDSKLVIEQFNKNWKINDESLKDMAKFAWTLSEDIKIPFTALHIKRDLNKNADALSNLACSSKYDVDSVKLKLQNIFKDE